MDICYLLECYLKYFYFENHIKVILVLFLFISYMS